MSDGHVKVLQLSLNQLYGRQVVRPDGVYGPRTKKAVEDFQELFGMPLHGDIGEQLTIVGRVLRGEGPGGAADPRLAEREAAERMAAEREAEDEANSGPARGLDRIRSGPIAQDAPELGTVPLGNQ